MTRAAMLPPSAKSGSLLMACTKRTSQPDRRMSAFRGKAEVGVGQLDFRVGPGADSRLKRRATRARDLGDDNSARSSRRELVAEGAARCALHDSLVAREADRALA